MKNLTANNLKIQPAVNQVELNFWNPQPELLAWSKENGLLLEAYSPLGSNKQVKETLSQPEVRKIADTLGITPAQAIISWHVQRGTVVLPKSVTPSRVEENFKGECSVVSVGKSEGLMRLLGSVPAPGRPVREAGESCSLAPSPAGRQPQQGMAPGVRRL